MKIVLASDEYYPVHQDIIQILPTLGHQVDLFGACASHREEPWVEVADQAAQSISEGLIPRSSASSYTLCHERESLYP
jgi:ribose 5-phosphate isomerase RpiB